MIVIVASDLKKIYRKKKNFLWPKPSCCARCRSNRLWGHGFVTAYFDGYLSQFYLRRYRCPDCGCVIQMKPEGFFPRFRAKISTIRSSISQRLSNGRYSDNLCRHRQAHWYRSLKKQAMARLTIEMQSDLLAAFDYLMNTGLIPVTRTI